MFINDFLRLDWRIRNIAKEKGLLICDMATSVGDEFIIDCKDGIYRFSHSPQFSEIHCTLRFYGQSGYYFLRGKYREYPIYYKCSYRDRESDTETQITEEEFLNELNKFRNCLRHEER